MADPNEWQIQEAKSKFSALIHDAQAVPQTITRHGIPVAVVLSATEYEALAGCAPRSLLEILQSAPFGELDIGPRDGADVARDVAF